MAVQLPVGADELLEALEGVAYLTTLDGTILAIGQRSWTWFATENGDPELTVASVVGRSLFDALHGETVQTAFRCLHGAVSAGRRSQTVFEFRCNSPIAERHMRMSISAVCQDKSLTRNQCGTTSAVFSMR